MHSAIDSENMEAVRLLVAAGANCNKRNEAGFTSLHRSAYKGQLGILKILLDSGKADINATTEGNADTI